MNKKFVGVVLYVVVVGAIIWGAGYLNWRYQTNKSAKLSAELDSLIDRSRNLEDYKKQASEGISIDTEPLKNLLGRFDYSTDNDPSEESIKALDEFLKLPAGKIANVINNSNNYAKLPCDVGETFRYASQYICFKIKSNPHDKALVKQCNADIIKLRDWLINSANIAEVISSAIEIDTERIETLRYVLRTDEYTKAEFDELLGTPVDWRQLYISMINNEVILVEPIAQQIHQGKFPTNMYIKEVRPSTPLMFIQLYGLKNHNQFMTLSIDLLKTLNSDQPLTNYNHDNDHRLYSWTSYDFIYIKYKIIDAENMMILAKTAADIMAQYQESGKFPTHPNIPLTANGEKIKYQYGNIEYSYNNNFYGFALTTPSYDEYIIKLPKDK